MEEYVKIIPSSGSLVAAYSSLSTSWVLFKTAYYQIIPRNLHNYAVSKLTSYFSHKNPSKSTFIIDDLWRGFNRNEIYDAARSYLATKIGPNNRTVKVGKLEHENNVSTEIPVGEKIIDKFQDITVEWRWCVQEQRGSNFERDANIDRPMPKIPRISSTGSNYYQLTFANKYREIVQNDYFSHVLNTYNFLKQEQKVLKHYYMDGHHGINWNANDFKHPATFDTIAMDADLKKSLIEDLDRFLRRKDYYERVGKAWKRGYLLYGPPGTGKSSLIAAMANYLKFDIYDLELNTLNYGLDLKRVLLNITNRSILVIEDIDCNSEVHDRSKTAIGHSEQFHPKKYQKAFTLSTLLNCIDGLWSIGGEARIIVFTTNQKEVLDPALVRPGRMDVHINMSYCTSEGFRVLAFNYLGIHDHKLYQEIDLLMENSKVTPASLSEELMKSDDADVALAQVVHFLKRKRTQDYEVEEEESKRQRTI